MQIKMQNDVQLLLSVGTSLEKGLDRVLSSQSWNPTYKLVSSWTRAKALVGGLARFFNATDY